MMRLGTIVTDPEVIERPDVPGGYLVHTAEIELQGGDPGARIFTIFLGQAPGLGWAFKKGAGVLAWVVGGTSYALLVFESAVADALNHMILALAGQDVKIGNNAAATFQAFMLYSVASSDFGKLNDRDDALAAAVRDAWNAAAAGSGTTWYNGTWATKPAATGGQASVGSKGHP